MKQQSQSNRKIKNYQSDTDQNIMKSRNDQSIDKAKAELKVLKQFISRRKECGSNDK